MNRTIDLSEQEDVVCKNCGNNIYLPAVRIKRISALISQTGKETIAPVQVFACTECGTIFNPYELDKKDKKKPTPPPPKVIKEGSQPPKPLYKGKS